MASNFYHKIAPHYGYPDNETGNCAGFIVGVRARQQMSMNRRQQQ
jgi:hypothetical protein